MRVLHLLKTSDAANWALRQMRELVKLGVDVHVLAPAGGKLLPLYEEVGVTVHPAQCSLPMSQPHTWPRLFHDFRATVAAIEPDVIHSHFVGTTLTMRLALGKSHPIPRLFQVPGPLHLEHPFFRNAEINTAGPADAWIGTCQWTCDRYERSGIARDRIFLSYYGNDVGVHQSEVPGRLRRELQLPVETKIVGMVAYIYAPKRFLGQRRGLKGHEDLIDALAILRATGRDVVGVFAGASFAGAVSYAEHLHDYARTQLGTHAYFLGHRNDVLHLYPDFDVAVHPSHSENVGGAAESQYLGIPTVATNIGGFPDLVIPGETGWLVPAKAPQALAHAIDEALSDPVKSARLSAKGRELAMHLFDIRRTSAEVRDIYTQVVERRSTNTNNSDNSSLFIRRGVNGEVF